MYITSWHSGLCIILWDIGKCESASVNLINSGSLRSWTAACGYYQRKCHLMAASVGDLHDDSNHFRWILFIWGLPPALSSAALRGSWPIEAECVVLESESLS